MMMTKNYEEVAEKLTGNENLNMEANDKETEETDKNEENEENENEIKL